MRIFEQIWNGSRTKFWCLKVILFKLVGRKFVRCFIALQNFKKNGRVYAIQNVLRICIFLNKNQFSLEKF